MVLPHNVVIDRQGTIRLIHAGGGEDHAKQIDQALASLLDPGARHTLKCE